MAFAERLGNFIWNPWLLGLFLLSGLYFSVRTGFFQLFHVRLWLKTTLGSLLRPKRRREGGGLTQLQALSTALASTIGTGSIAGVATAIFYGGPGAVFWMWVSAFLGMMTGCVEKTLAVRYREKSRDGGWQGGPMCYMERGVGSRTLAALFSLCCVAASLGGGNVVQANSIAASLEAAFGWDRLAVGLVVAVLTGLVILGGIGRIGRVSETLVPCMALLFIGGGVMVPDLPPGGHSRGAGAHRDGRRHTQGGPGGRHRVRHGRSHALRRGPRCIHKRGRHGLLRHRPRRLQRTGTGRAGDVGHF